MTQDQQPPEYFDFQQLRPQDLVVEVSTTPMYMELERIPSGFNPVGKIYVEGRLFRNLASGDAHWWLMIAAWGTVGTNVIVSVLAMLLAGESMALLPLIITIIPLMPLVRGTTTKLGKPRQESQASDGELE